MGTVKISELNNISSSKDIQNDDEFLVVCGYSSQKTEIEELNSGSCNLQIEFYDLKEYPDLSHNVIKISESEYNWPVGNFYSDSGVSNITSECDLSEIDILSEDVYATYWDSTGTKKITEDSISHLGMNFPIKFEDGTQFELNNYTFTVKYAIILGGSEEILGPATRKINVVDINNNLESNQDPWEHINFNEYESPQLVPTEDYTPGEFVEIDDLLADTNSNSNSLVYKIQIENRQLDEDGEFQYTLTFTLDSSNPTMVINWGDGTPLKSIKGVYGPSYINHTYTSSGTFEITLTTNTLNKIGELNVYSKHSKVFKEIVSWGNTGVKSIKGFFCGVKTANSVAPSSIPSTVTDITGAFYGSSINAQSISKWDTTNVTRMDDLFCKSKFDVFPDLSAWNVTNVTSMRAMFVDIHQSSLQGKLNIETWNTSSLVDMTLMFAHNYTTERFIPDITKWNLEKVEMVSRIFQHTVNFNEPWIINLKTQNIKKFDYMFYGCNSFDQPIGVWDISSATDISFMLGLTKFNQPLNEWNVSKVKDMKYLFSSNTVFNQPLDKWDTSSVTNMSGMFKFAYAFNESIDTWNTSSVLSLAGMFNRALNFNKQINTKEIKTEQENYIAWDTSSVVEMGGMFEGAIKFNQPIGNWNTSSVKRMDAMFKGQSMQLMKFNQPIENWDVSRVESMQEMFQKCPFNQPIGTWNTKSLKSIMGMFRGNTSVFDQDIGNWDISNLRNAWYFMQDNDPGLSIKNYDNLLDGWSRKTDNETFINRRQYLDVGLSKFSNKGELGKNILTKTYGWNIRDGGKTNIVVHTPTPTSITSNPTPTPTPVADLTPTPTPMPSNLSYKSEKINFGDIKNKLLNKFLVDIKEDLTPTQGSAGQKGEKGFEGGAGFQGDTGDIGLPGEKGNSGLQGETGIKGSSGEDGSKGEPGETGNKGNKGSKGIVGIYGDKGHVGQDSVEKGNKGPKGNQGFQGQIGDNASRSLGPRGSVGDFGEPVFGLKGNKGQLGISSPEIAQIGDVGGVGEKYKYEYHPRKSFYMNGAYNHGRLSLKKDEVNAFVAGPFNINDAELNNSRFIYFDLKSVYPIQIHNEFTIGSTRLEIDLEPMFNSNQNPVMCKVASALCKTDTNEGGFIGMHFTKNENEFYFRFYAIFNETTVPCSIEKYGIFIPNEIAISHEPYKHYLRI